MKTDRIRMKSCDNYIPTVKGDCLRENEGTCHETSFPCPYMSKPFSLRQQELADWQENNFPKSLYDHMDRDDLINRIRILELSVGMAEEVGELSHIILKASQKIREGVSGKIDKDLVADGFSDTVIYGTQLMTRLGIDAESVLAKTINTVLARNWINDRKDGNSSESESTKQGSILCYWDKIEAGANPFDILKRKGILYTTYSKNIENNTIIFTGCSNVPIFLPKGFELC